MRRVNPRWLLLAASAAFALVLFQAGVAADVPNPNADEVLGSVTGGGEGDDPTTTTSSSTSTTSSTETSTTSAATTTTTTGTGQAENGDSGELNAAADSEDDGGDPAQQVQGEDRSSEGDAADDPESAESTGSVEPLAADPEGNLPVWMIPAAVGGAGSLIIAFWFINKRKGGSW